MISTKINFKTNILEAFVKTKIYTLFFVFIISVCFLTSCKSGEENLKDPKFVSGLMEKFLHNQYKSKLVWTIKIRETSNGQYDEYKIMPASVKSVESVLSKIYQIKKGSKKYYRLEIRTELGIKASQFSTGTEFRVPKNQFIFIQ
jgi:broad specificity polyphosphatase/5'/3'-nucleotidase SurE